jgi:membrane-associated phospholipid phosphatase
MYTLNQILAFKISILMVMLSLLSQCTLVAQERCDTGAAVPPAIAIDSVKRLEAMASMGFKNDTLKPEDTAQLHYFRINGAYLKTYGYDLKHIVTKPFHWEGKDWIKVAAITGTTGVLIVSLETSKLLYPLGNRFPPVMLGGMYVTSLVTKNRRLEHATLSATKSLAIATIIYTCSKSIIRRQRPTRTDDPLNFVAPFTKKGYTSFPSGHANTAFSLATAFALEYKDVKWVPWLAYTLASLTSVSRLYDDRHWISDVVLGASIGHFVTKAVYRLDEKRKIAGKAHLKTWQGMGF